jgi:protein-S-isoprenylcysteine O-methyltransferase Ste14
LGWRERFNRPTSHRQVNKMEMLRTGADALFTHVPELRDPARRMLVGLTALASFAVATAVMLLVDLFWPAWTGLGQVVMILAAFVWAGQFFWRRNAYRARWGGRAYARAFGRHMLIGLPMIMAAIAHTAYAPGERITLGWLTPEVSMLGLYFAVTGLALWVRAALTLGIDNLAMLYVYFPLESRLVESSIYAVIRHPVYSAVIRVGLALGLWRGTWFSIAFALFMPIGLTLWLWLVEEPELIERFGRGYADYRRTVPAFWPRLPDVGKFLEFLICGHEPGQ